MIFTPIGTYLPYLWQNYLSNEFKLFDSLLKKGWWYTSFIIDNNIVYLMASSPGYNSIFWLLMTQVFSNSIKLLSHYDQSISCVEHFSFYFPSNFFVYQLDFSVFGPAERWMSCCFPACFGFAVLCTFVDAVVNAGCRE